jgi:DNA helicase-2/ATP-dependent DNA helicase PcrA
MKHKTTTIFGPPGTGKTTKLLKIVEEALQSGMSPEDIAYVSFTKKAADEAIERASLKFGLPTKDFKYFRTLHSFAFRELRMEKKDVMSFGDYMSISKTTGYEFSNHRVSEDGSFNMLSTKGDRILFLENLSRITCLGVEEAWKKYHDDDVSLSELQYLSQILFQYKSNRLKLDFTDMLNSFINTCEVKPFKLFIVDEAQDLSMIQWKMVYKIAEHADTIYVAGDDDQAIYNWAGAQVSEFLALNNNQQVLNQSYRIPATVHKLATKVSSRIIQRREKEYLPRTEPGTINYVSEIEQIDMSKGNWLLLGRNVFVLERYVLHCLERGYLFSSRVQCPIREESILAIKTWETLRLGKYVRAEHVKVVYDFMSTRTRVKWGCKKKIEELPDEQGLCLQDLLTHYGLQTDALWRVALDKLTNQEQEYIVMALKNGEKMLTEPRIKINTIHGAKGGEADNVVLISDMSWRTWNEMEKDPCSEHRVWYVGITRTKNNLFIVNPESRYSYSF